MTTTKLGIFIVAFSTLIGCSENDASFSVLPTAQNFQQSTTDTKIDILWVVDNSGSMQTSQKNLADNFPVFIQGFSSRNLDFQIAVTGSDAYVALPAMAPIYNSGYYPYLQERAQSDWAKFRDGGSLAEHHQQTGIYILDRLTPNLNDVFVTNVTLGTDGLGDERPLQSMKVSLASSLNGGFLRSGGFLAVIMLTDEDDFSHDGYNYLENQYSNPALHTIQSYVDYLDGLTTSAASHRNYSVNSITIKDSACLQQLANGGRKIAQRVNALAEATGGILASLCGSFGTEMDRIAEGILQLATQFYLTRQPVPESIIVSVNSVTVPKVENHPSGGWSYNSTSNSIMFHGDAIPPQGSQIQVYFDPVSLGQ